MNSIILTYVLSIYVSAKIVSWSHKTSVVYKTQGSPPNNNHKLQQHPERYSEQTEEEQTMDPVIRYDPKADILASKLEEGETVDEKLLNSDTLLSMGHDGHTVSLEVYDTSKTGSIVCRSTRNT